MMFCCNCDLEKRHHPTKSCDGCACFWTDDVVPNPFKPLKKFAEQMRKSAIQIQKSMEKIPKDEL